MLPPTTQPPEWDSADANNLKLFLGTPTGTRMLGHLYFLCPSLLDGSDVNKTLVASGAVKGYTRAVETLISLTTEKPATPVVSESYPSLENDALWNDLETPNPTK